MKTRNAVYVFWFLGLRSNFDQRKSEFKGNQNS